MPVPANLKRKATDDPQSPSERPSRRVAVESRARFDPQPTTRGPVEPNSIEAILRHHSRDRLYVPPVAWTSIQLRLLNCRFTLQQAGPLKEQVKDPPQSQSIGSDPPVRNSRRRHTPSDLCRAMFQFGGRRTSEAKRSAIKDILHAYDICPLSYEILSFYFRRQPAANVWTEGVFSRKSAPPSLAYVTFDGIQSHRSDYVHNSPAKPFNEPVANIRNRKLRSLQPLNTVEDPYIMGVLIALAQAQWRHQEGTEQHGEEAAECSIMQRDGGHTANGTSSRTPPPPRCIPGRGPHDCSQVLRVNVLATSGDEDGYLYVYTASISAAFLRKFDEPWRYSPGYPVVAYYRISLKSPIKSLSRLHRVLCAGSCRFCASGNPQAPG